MQRPKVLLLAHFAANEVITMAKAKQLPSGAWRVQVYSHSEIVVQPDGSPKKIYYILRGE